MTPEFLIPAYIHRTYYNFFKTNMQFITCLRRVSFPCDVEMLLLRIRPGEDRKGMGLCVKHPLVELDIIYIVKSEI